MRRAGEVRLALLRAAVALSTPDRAPTQRELAECAGVSYGATRQTVRDMVRAGVLRVARTRRVPYRNRPVAEYAPAAGRVEPASAGFGLLQAVWRRSRAA